MIKRTTSAVVATFLIVFGDFMISGYFREISSTLLRTVSYHTLTTQIMKFSGYAVCRNSFKIFEGTPWWTVTVITTTYAE